jgi:hypothetical protein
VPRSGAHRQKRPASHMGRMGAFASHALATPTGTPIDPRTFSWQFAAWWETADVPVVRMHHLRHTLACCCCCPFLLA